MLAPDTALTLYSCTAQALCDASAGLTNFAHEDRQWALIRGLEDISQEVQAASRSGVAIWSPMGSGNQRIVRIAARDAKLLNSRCATRATRVMKPDFAILLHSQSDLMSDSSGMGGATRAVFKLLCVPWLDAQ